MTQAHTTDQQLSNPSVDAGAAARRERPPRRPMSTAQQRLAVAEIPGWHLHFFREDNVPAALDAYYEIVGKDEVKLNQQNVSLGHETSGNTDMGAGVSIVAGQNAAGQPVRLFLMKIKEEYWREDQKALETRNVQIMQTIFGEEAQVGMGGAIEDRDELTYINPKKTALMNRKIRKARIRRAGR